MNFDLYEFRLLLLLSGIFNFVLAGSRDRSSCVQHCGGFSNRVLYPFGFSLGCPIRLHCDSATGGFRLGDLAVRNITSDHVLVDFPAQCNRSVGEISGLYGRSYAPTRRNAFLFQKCSSPVPSCVVPAPLLEERYRLRSCGVRGENISCFSRGAAADGATSGAYVRRGDVDELRCESLYSSVVVDYASRIPAVSLQFQTVELGWWIPGKCNCSRHATCTEVSSPVDRRPGFRCQCREGFVGDGFSGGEGCRRVNQKCNPSKYMSGHCGGTTRVGVLVGGIIAGASLMAALSLLCFFIRRRSASLRDRRSIRRLLSEATAGSWTVPLYPYKEMEKATNHFSEKQRLGTGAYGTVYAGKLHGHEWVAIKKFKHPDSDGMEQVINEIRLLSSVSHHNLVKLLGCCIERDEQILVYEFMPNGSLSQHLQRERGDGLPWATRLSIAAETAKAIAYLHTAVNPPIFHRDIKSSNILLDCSFNSKLADFGLSRLGTTDSSPSSSHISTAPQGTPGYLDPQYHQNFHLSDKSDVYSFGVLLVEIISGLKVIDFNRAHNDVNLAALAVDRIGKGRVDEIIDPFLEAQTDAWTLTSARKLAELAFRCLAYHRDMRPSMMEVATELERIRSSGWAPMDHGICLGPSDSSACFSPLNGSENSPKTRKGETTESPVSVEEPWFSEQSSPSTSNLLGKVVL